MIPTLFCMAFVLQPILPGMSLRIHSTGYDSSFESELQRTGVSIVRVSNLTSSAGLVFEDAYIG